MTSPSPPNDSLARNIQVVADLEREATRRRSIAARICGRLTNYAGTTWSIVLHAAWFVVWIALNTGFRGFRPFDPFPFQLLTSVVSLESIFLTLFVLASQNRLTKEADKRTHLDLQVNMLAEQEMTLVTPDLMPERQTASGTGLPKGPNVGGIVRESWSFWPSCSERHLANGVTSEGTTGTQMRAPAQNPSPEQACDCSDGAAMAMIEERWPAPT